MYDVLSFRIKLRIYLQVPNSSFYMYMYFIIANIWKESCYPHPSPPPATNSTSTMKLFIIRKSVPFKMFCYKEHLSDRISEWRLMLRRLEKKTLKTVWPECILSKFKSFNANLKQYCRYLYTRPCMINHIWGLKQL